MSNGMRKWTENKTNYIVQNRQKTDSKSSAIEKLMCNIYKSGDEMENMHKKQKKIMGKL
jgi:hypothetical protein